MSASTSSMQSYLASKYMSGPKADAILSRADPEKRKKKKRKNADASTSTGGAGSLNMIVDDDGGWDGKHGTAQEEDDDMEDVVVASDRSFKKRRTTGKESGAGEGEAESLGWATIREGVKKEDSPPPPDERPQVVDAPAPTVGGLVKASDMKKRLQRERDAERKRKDAVTEAEQEEARLAQETVYRDASGRKIDTKAERAAAARAKREKEEAEAAKMEWGKGLVQRGEEEERRKRMEKERSRDLAVYADDKELNEEMKAADRWNDPAARFLAKKKDKGPRRPEYKGPPPPPNRFGIKPGYRWDGVDRGNGFEKKMFQKQNERKRTDLESYQWRVDDM